MTMTRRDLVTLNGKHYSVTIREDGRISIWTSWQVPSVADRWSVHPTMIDMSTSVSPYGRLGKKILAALPPLRERLCTPMTVGEASIAASTVR